MCIMSHIGGLLDSTVDQLKALSSKVKGDSVHLASQSNKKKKVHSPYTLLRVRKTGAQI